MCGIYGIVGKAGRTVVPSDFERLAIVSQRRGSDASGILLGSDGRGSIYRDGIPADQLLKKVKIGCADFALGHCRLITDGAHDHQPILKDNVVVFHNGIVLNAEKLWSEFNLERELEVDSEIIAGIATTHATTGGDLANLGLRVLELCDGVVACAIAFPKLGKLLLFSNNGSLFCGETSDFMFFASEKYFLEQFGCEVVRQIFDSVIIDLPPLIDIDVHQWKVEPKVGPEAVTAIVDGHESLLVYPEVHLTRCSRCILTETMPFISFDSDGVCNYCNNYVVRSQPRPIDELQELLQKYRRRSGPDCIVPFSGGRDSSFGLHLIVKELKMNPITYTYDWGMVTPLGRRNVSRMCSELGVENIVISANIKQKRSNIAKNLRAWLKNPDLGMISILTAGDKHFFKYVKTLNHELGISLNLWGTSPLETTYFKSGFLGTPPNFKQNGVYSSGVLRQLGYQRRRLMAMLRSPDYFNDSLWDTLSGEYYRSISSKRDYFHIFDYWQWEESSVNEILDSYSWEKAVDTKTTWRIGDGTAGFYNYIFYTVAGFSEHDTFRSNQIREGHISREEALERVREENRPRYANIKWYLDSLGFDFQEVIEIVNAIPRLYSKNTQNV